MLSLSSDTLAAMPWVFLFLFLASAAAADDVVRVDLFRSSDGTVEVAKERHETGLFSQTTWLRLLEEAGFTPESVVEETEEDRPPRVLFIGRVP